MSPLDPLDFVQKVLAWHGNDWIVSSSLFPAQTDFLNVTVWILDGGLPTGLISIQCLELKLVSQCADHNLGFCPPLVSYCLRIGNLNTVISFERGRKYKIVFLNSGWDLTSICDRCLVAQLLNKLIFVIWNALVTSDNIWRERNTL